MSTKINAKEVLYSVTNRSVHDALLGKQKKLIAGQNITIADDGTISASGGGGGSDPDAVKYTAQSRSETEKAQARTNIGAVAAESGKGLSTNDYTTAEKNKLAGIDVDYTAQTVKANGRELGTNSNPILNATHSEFADSADQADADGDGNSITATYATKTELANGLSGKLNVFQSSDAGKCVIIKNDGTLNPVSSADMSVGYAENANDANTIDGHEYTEFATVSHNHDDRYYTEAEINSRLSAKQNLLIQGIGVNISAANVISAKYDNDTIKLDNSGNLGVNPTKYATRCTLNLVTIEKSLYLISNSLLDLSDIRIARKGRWRIREVGRRGPYWNKNGYRCMNGNQTSNRYSYYQLKITAVLDTDSTTMYPNGDYMRRYALKITDKANTSNQVSLNAESLLKWFITTSADKITYHNGRKRKDIYDSTCAETNMLYKAIHTLHFGIGINGGTTIIPFDVKVRAYMFRIVNSGGQFSYEVRRKVDGEWEWATNTLNTFSEIVV